MKMDSISLAFKIQNSKQIKPVQTIYDHHDGISSLASSTFLPQNVLVGCFDKTLSEYDINSFRQIKKMQGHTGGIWACDYSPVKQNFAVSAGSDTLIKLWDTNSAKCVETLKAHNSHIYDVKFSQDGKYIASCSKEIINIWDTKNLNKPIDIVNLRRQNPQDGFIYCVNFLNDSQSVISGFIDGTILVHNIGSSMDDDKSNLNTEIVPDYIEKYKQDEEYSKSVYAIHKFHNKESRIALTHSDGSVRLYDIKMQEKKVKKVDQFFYFTSDVTCCDTSSDDKTIAACGKDRSCEVWKLNTHDKIDYTLTGHSGIISSCVFIKNNKNNIIVTGSYDNKIRIYRLE